MNGAEKLLGTLVTSGIDVCFSNPGTSEMQLTDAMEGQGPCLIEAMVVQQMPG